MEMTIDKQNGNVAYNDENHLYWEKDTDLKYISVTTLIGKFEQPFDKEFWSAYKALERLIDPTEFAIEKKELLSKKKFDKFSLLLAYGIEEDDFNSVQQDILDEWDKKNRESCERGTAIHAKLENAMYGRNDITLDKYNIGGKFECKQNYNKLDLECGVYPEYLIYYKDKEGVVRLAGQIDLLVKNGNNIYICDYKGLPLDTKIPTINGWSTIGEIKVGETIFDKNGNPTKIINKSEIHHNPCYKISFDNGDSIIADHEHRWEVSFLTNSKCKYRQKIMTTEEIFNHLQTVKRSAYTIPKILNPKPLQTEIKQLPLDPYILGCWLGDGSKSCGIITQSKNSKLWTEIERRGYKISNNLQHSEDRENTEMRTIYNIQGILKQLNVLNNKHIPDIYQRASYEQRLDLLRGLMDTDGYYNESRKRYVMSTGQEWQRDAMICLLASLGVKTTVFNSKRKLNGKIFDAWDVCFSTNDFNPFLIRNQNNILDQKKDKRSFRNIIKVEPVDTIPTQCLLVDSSTHTFLCTEKMIVTHNTNGKIDKKSGYNSSTRSTTKMKFPLNNLDDCNYWHYNMQLSTYAWMIQQLNPNFEIKDLVMIHFDHSDNMTVYHLDYLKDEVEKMLSFYKKEVILEDKKRKRKKIEY